MTAVATRRAFLGGALGLPLIGPSRALAAPSGFVPDGYRLSFADEFDDPDVRRINEEATGGHQGAPAWRSRYRHPRKDVINKEKQIYMDRSFAGTGRSPLGVDPFRIDGGVLHITAQRADPERVRPLIWDKAYTSGCISSERTHAQRYGYVEVRAKMPAGRGFWPALWLMPASGQWPPEIDIVEGSGVKPRSVHNGVVARKRPAGSTVPAPNAGRLTGRWIDGVADTTSDFRIYGLEWTPDRIAFFLDGRQTFEVTDHGIHEDMYFLANLALGSHDPNWIPDPDATTTFPGVFSIDYVRFYTRA